MIFISGRACTASATTSSRRKLAPNRPAVTRRAALSATSRPTSAFADAEPVATLGSGRLLDLRVSKGAAAALRRAGRTPTTTPAAFAARRANSRTRHPRGPRPIGASRWERPPRGRARQITSGGRTHHRRQGSSAVNEAHGSGGVALPCGNTVRKQPVEPG